MDAKDFASRLVKRLRKRAEDYGNFKVVGFGDVVQNQAVARALTETADCIEEALATFDDE